MIPLNVNLPLKTVTDRIQSCKTVLGALDAFGDRLVGELCGSFDPLLADGQVTPFETQLELFKKKLTLDLDAVVSSARAYRDQRARETLFRGRRDKQVTEVNSDVVGLRRAFTGIYSEEKLAEFGFARRTPQQPGELVEQATHLVTHLDDPDLDLSGARFDQFKVDVPELARKLVGSVEKLQIAIDEVVREERRAEAMKLAKDEALEKYNRSFLWIARTLESLFQLAGLEEVAKRIRPSSRRAGVTEKVEQSKDDESTGETEGDASQEASPEAAESASGSS